MIRLVTNTSWSNKQYKVSGGIPLWMEWKCSSWVSTLRNVEMEACERLDGSIDLQSSAEYWPRQPDLTTFNMLVCTESVRLPLFSGQ
jgi:hypothetical protein